MKGPILAYRLIGVTLRLTACVGIGPLPPEVSLLGRPQCLSECCPLKCNLFCSARIFLRNAKTSPWVAMLFMA